MHSRLPWCHQNTLSTKEVIYLDIRSGGGSQRVKLVIANLLEAKSPSPRSRCSTTWRALVLVIRCTQYRNSVEVILSISPRALKHFSRSRLHQSREVDARGITFRGCNIRSHCLLTIGCFAYVSFSWEWLGKFLVGTRMKFVYDVAGTSLRVVLCSAVSSGGYLRCAFS